MRRACARLFYCFEYFARLILQQCDALRKVPKYRDKSAFSDSPAGMYPQGVRVSIF